jgi:cytochrome c556
MLTKTLLDKKIMITTELDKWRTAMIKTDKTELSKWRESEYPYDFAECGHCATQHDYRSRYRCCTSAHAEMWQEAQKLELFKIVYSDDPEKLRNAVLAFREKFAEFYKRKT